MTTSVTVTQLRITKKKERVKAFVTLLNVERQRTTSSDN